jgi:hypothetical protein
MSPYYFLAWLQAPLVSLRYLVGLRRIHRQIPIRMMTGSHFKKAAMEERIECQRKRELEVQNRIKTMFRDLYPGVSIVMVVEWQVGSPKWM